MNKPDISKHISKLKAYTPATLSCVGVAALMMSNQVFIHRTQALAKAQYLSKTALAAYKRERNNWRKLHGKPMKRHKQLEKIKSFY